ncbi:MAG: glycosyltransferase family 2 protein [Alphaproteobacteria bacterium]
MEPRDEAAAAPRIAVVVLDWNGGADTLAAVESVLADRGDLELDTIVVDNASREPVLDEVRRRHPEVRVVANPRNEGYAGGNNVGIRLALEAGADWVLVLNNDAVLRPGALRALVDTARADPSIAAVGAKILRAEDPSRLWLAWGEISWRQSLVRLVGAGEPDGPRWSSARDVPWVSGCAILLARRAIERIGPFDEAYFAYHEEVDWCARAREAGFRVAWQPAAVVLHRGQASSGGPVYVSRRQYLTARNMVRFVRTHGTLAERARFWAFLGASLPLQWIRRAVTGEQEGVRLKVAGVRDALRGAPIPRRELGLDG